MNLNTFPPKLLIVLFLAIMFSCNTNQKKSQDTLEKALFGFENPQDSTRTKTWWFHGDTETTTEGIPADLEAFKRAGIGGVVYYDQSHGRAENALPGFSPEWWKMLRFSAEEAKRTGLSFEIHVSNGFVAGGPWITNEYSMKRLAATELLLEGGKYFEGKLETPINRHNFYKDVAVLAFPAQTGLGISSNNTSVSISSNVEGLDLDNLFNQKSEVLTKIPVHKNGESVYINLQFEEDFTARSITYDVRPKGKATTSATNVPDSPQETFVGTGYRILPDLGQLEVSVDGINYTQVCNLKPVYRAHENWRQKTISFPAVKGRFYRINLHDWWEEDDKSPEMQLGRVVINSAAKLDQWEEKAAFYSEYIERDQTPEYDISEAINASHILDISDKMSSDGVLKWDVPEGNWLVMRFAYVPTGGYTKHGRRNLMGRECDKLSVAAAELQWKNYVGQIIDSLKITNSGNLSGVVIDSHEAGSQNWTDNFIEEFSERRGYNPTLWLPAMMGYVINDVRASDGFLFDIRRNIADMISDNYYGTFERLCNENNLILTAQATGNALCIVADPIQAKSKVTKPQGEFWPIHPDGNYDIKESSSAARLYGKHVASAEAYTDAKYNHSIADLKSLADYAYAFGINEFVICASTHQPWLDRFPGNTGGGREYAINRNNTWWEYSRSFWDYQSRSAYILRCGKSSADLCVYLGENAPVKILTYRLPDIPGGFDFDAFTTDALLKRMKAKNGKITLPDGVNYKMMILPRNGDITFAALKKIAEMVKQGICIYGAKPSHSKSQKDTEKDAEYKRIVDELWGINPAQIGSKQSGKGTVYWGMPLSEAIDKAGIKPDIAMEQGNTKDNMIYFTHRKLTDADIYFVANRKDSSEETTFTFSAKGKYAQFWNPVTGERYSLRVDKNDKNGTSTNLYMAPRESFFVVITDNYEELPLIDWYKTSDLSENVEGAWEVYFDEKRGGAGYTIFDTLTDWTENENPAIKYYSGTAIYKKNININPANNKIFLETGNPNFVARVIVNSQDAGVIWCSPWALEITQYLKSGNNNLEIHVANSLVNRMAYDASLPENQQITYSYPKIISANAELIPSGLKQVKIVRK
jgi:hypothetical protein